MPKYRMTQYGLHQYGQFESGPVIPGVGRKWQFIRSRFGVHRDGTTLWLYQHRPASFKGQSRKLRIQTNLGETIKEESVSLTGGFVQVRISSNLTETPIMSKRIERSTTE